MTTTYTTAKGTFEQASDKQVAFIKKLAEERAYGDVYLQTQLDANHVSQAADLSKSAASHVIGVLLGEPYKSGAKKGDKPNVEATPGFYTDGTDFYEVVKAKTTGNTYAKVLLLKPTGKTCGGCEACDGENACKVMKGSWSYAQGAMKNFQKWEKASLEVTAEFGKKWGVCMVCGRTLTNPDSIAAGIGPICQGGF